MTSLQRGQRIRELWEIHNYTRERFAEKVDISAKFLYEIETGKKGFSVEILYRISKALSVSCDYIVQGEEMEHGDVEKIVCELAMLEPKQVRKIQEILNILLEMCEKI